MWVGMRNFSISPFWGEGGGEGKRCFGFGCEWVFFFFEGSWGLRGGWMWRGVGCGWGVGERGMDEGKEGV